MPNAQKPPPAPGAQPAPGEPGSADPNAKVIPAGQRPQPGAPGSTVDVSTGQPVTTGIPKRPTDANSGVQLTVAGPNPAGQKPLGNSPNGLANGAAKTANLADRGSQSPAPCGQGGDCAPGSKTPGVPPAPANASSGTGPGSGSGGATALAVAHRKQTTGDIDNTQQTGQLKHDPRTSQRSPEQGRAPPGSGDHDADHDSARTVTSSPSQKAVRSETGADTGGDTDTRVALASTQQTGQPQSGQQQQVVQPQRSDAHPAPASTETPRVVPAVAEQKQPQQSNTQTSDAPGGDDKKTTPAPGNAPAPGSAPVPGGAPAGGAEPPADGPQRPPLMFGGAPGSGGDGDTGTALDHIGDRGPQKQPCGGQDGCGGQPAPATPAPVPGSNGPANMGGGQSGNGPGGGGQLATEHNGTTPRVRPGTQRGADQTLLAVSSPGRSSAQLRGPPSAPSSQPLTGGTSTVDNAKLAEALRGLRSPGGSGKGPRALIGTAPVFAHPIPDGTNPNPKTIANIKSAALTTPSGKQENKPDQIQTTGTPAVKLVANQQPIPGGQQGDQPRPRHSVSATPDEHGNWKVTFGEDGHEIDAGCVAPCKPGWHADGFSGQRARMTEHGMELSDPSVPGKPADTCVSQDGCSTGRDDNGHGHFTVYGNGSAHDGVTGSNMNYSGGKPAGSSSPGPTANAGDLGGPDGSPFTTSCHGGCNGDISNGKGKTDHVELADTPGQLRGRDAAGRAGDYSHSGQGVVKTAEGYVITSDGNGLKGADSHTTITTPDAVTGAGPRYEVEDGQTGSLVDPHGHGVRLNDPSRITRKVNEEETRKNSASGNPVIDVLHENEDNKISFTGGLIDCYGSCAPVRPASQVQSGPCQDCHMQVAPPGGKNPFGAVSVRNQGGEGPLGLTDPYGNRGICQGPTCQLTQRNGPGGITVCTHAASCSTSNMQGDSRNCGGQGGGECGVYLLNRTEDGGHAGYACSRGAACTGAGTTTKFDWFGNNDSGDLNLINDPTLRRAPTDLPIDQRLKADPRSGFARDGKLPVLDQTALDRLKPNELQKYRDATGAPRLSDLDKGLAIGDTADQAVKAKEIKEAVARMNARARAVVDDGEKALKNGLTSSEKERLQGELRSLDPQARKRAADFFAARNIVNNAQSIAEGSDIDGLDGIGADPRLKDPRTTAAIDHVLHPDSDKPNPNPTLEGELPGVGKALGDPDRGRGGVNVLGQPLDDHEKLLPAPTPEELDKGDADRIAALSAVPWQNDAELRQAAHDQRITDINNGAPTTPGERDALKAEQDAINAERRDYQSPIRPSDASEGQRRGLDQVFVDAHSDEDPEMARSLREMTDLEDRATRLGDAMAKTKDQGQKNLAAAFHTIGQLGQLGRDTVVRDQSSRAPGNTLQIRLPSTGAPDAYFAMRSAINWSNPGFDSDPKLRDLINSGGTQDGPFHGTPADVRAKLAAEGTPDEVARDIRGAHDDPNAEAEIRDWAGRMGLDPAQTLKNIKDYAGPGGTIAQRDVLVTGKDGANHVLAGFVVTKGPGMPSDVSPDGPPAPLVGEVNPANGEDMGGVGGPALVASRSQFFDITGAHYGSFEDFQQNNELVGPDEVITGAKNLAAPPGADDSEVASGAGHVTPTWKKVTGAGLAVAGAASMATGVGEVMVGVIAVSAGMSASDLGNRAAHGQTINPAKSFAAASDYADIALDSAWGIGGALKGVATAGSRLYGASGVMEKVGNYGFNTMLAGSAGADLYTAVSPETGPNERSEALVSLGETAVFLGGAAIGKARGVNTRVKIGKALSGPETGSAADARAPARLGRDPLSGAPAAEPEAGGRPVPAAEPQGAGDNKVAGEPRPSVEAPRTDSRPAERAGSEESTESPRASEETRENLGGRTEPRTDAEPRSDAEPRTDADESRAAGAARGTRGAERAGRPGSEAESGTEAAEPGGSRAAEPARGTGRAEPRTEAGPRGGTEERTGPGGLRGLLRRSVDRVTGRGGPRTEGGAQTERPEPLRTGPTQPQTRQTGQEGRRSAGGQAGNEAEPGGAPAQRVNRIGRLINRWLNRGGERTGGPAARGLPGQPSRGVPSQNGQGGSGTPRGSGEGQPGGPPTAPRREGDGNGRPAPPREGEGEGPGSPAPSRPGRTPLNETQGTDKDSRRGSRSSVDSGKDTSGGGKPPPGNGPAPRNTRLNDRGGHGSPDVTRKGPDQQGWTKRERGPPPGQRSTSGTDRGAPSAEGGEADAENASGHGKASGKQAGDAVDDGTSKTTTSGTRAGERPAADEPTEDAQEHTARTGNKPTQEKERLNPEDDTDNSSDPASADQDIDARPGAAPSAGERAPDGSKVIKVDSGAPETGKPGGWLSRLRTRLGAALARGCTNNCALVGFMRGKAANPGGVDPAQVKAPPWWRSTRFVFWKLQRAFRGHFQAVTRDRLDAADEAFVVAWKDGDEVGHLLYKRGTSWYDNRRPGALTSEEVNRALDGAHLRALFPGSGNARGLGTAEALPRAVGADPVRPAAEEERPASSATGPAGGEPIGEVVPGVSVSDVTDGATHLYDSGKLARQFADSEQLPRTIDGALDALKKAGVDTVDHTGEPHDRQLHETLDEPDPAKISGTDHEVVGATMRPSVHVNGVRTQKGSVKVLRPDTEADFETSLSEIKKGRGYDSRDRAGSDLPASAEVVGAELAAARERVGEAVELANSTKWTDDAAAKRVRDELKATAELLDPDKLGPEDNGALVAKAFVDARDPSEVDPAEVRKASPADQDMAAFREEFVHRYGGDWRAIGNRQLAKIMRHAYVDAKVIVLSWKKGAKTARVWVGHRTSEGMRYYNREHFGENAATEAPEDTRLVMVLGPAREGAREVLPSPARKALDARARANDLAARVEEKDRDVAAAQAKVDKLKLANQATPEARQRLEVAEAEHARAVAAARQARAEAEQAQQHAEWAEQETDRADIASDGGDQPSRTFTPQARKAQRAEEATRAEAEKQATEKVADARIDKANADMDVATKKVRAQWSQAVKDWRTAMKKWWNALMKQGKVGEATKQTEIAREQARLVKDLEKVKKATQAELKAVKEIAEAEKRAAQREEKLARLRAELADGEAEEADLAGAREVNREGGHEQRAKELRAEIQRLRREVYEAEALAGRAKKAREELDVAKWTKEKERLDREWKTADEGGRGQIEARRWEAFVELISAEDRKEEARVQELAGEGKSVLADWMEGRRDEMDKLKKEIPEDLPLEQQMKAFAAKWKEFEDPANPPNSAEVQGLLAEVIRREFDGHPVLDEGQWGLISELERGSGNRLLWYGTRVLLRRPALARGVVAELRSGQGKTYSVAVHVFQKSLTSHVDVRFPTETLAKRDFEEKYQPIAKWLGKGDEVGRVRQREDQDYKDENQRAAYRKRITLGLDSTFKFDFLRDQEALRSTDGERGEPFQKYHDHLVTDEVDQIKLDRGATPHVLAELAAETPERNEARSRDRHAAKDAVGQLRGNEHYKITDNGSPQLTRAGREMTQKLAPGVSEEMIAQAILAERHIRYMHYRLVDGQVVITDYRFSGYPLLGQRYRGGLHEAIAAKEGLPIGSPQETSALTTEARFAGLYESEAGVTGTVAGSKQDKRSFIWYYRSRIARVYTSKNGPGVEKLPPRFYLTQEAMFAAKAEESAAAREAGSVLTFSQTDLEAERLAATRRHNRQGESETLTADPNHLADEQDIIRRAARKGALVDATPVGGRGTDIEADYLQVLRGRSYTGRGDRQMDTRTGRRDRPGATREYGSLGDPFLDQYANPVRLQRLRAKYRALVEAGRLHPLDEIRDPEIKELYDEAQRNSELANYRQLGRTIRNPNSSETVVAETTVRGRAGGPTDQTRATPQAEPGQPTEFSEAADRVHDYGAEVTTTFEKLKNAKNAQNNLRDDATPAERDQIRNDLDGAAQAYSDAQQRLSRAVDDYRKLLNKAPPHAPTRTATPDATTDNSETARDTGATGQQPDEQHGQTHDDAKPAIPMAPVLAARPEDAQQAETQARDRDYQAAIDTLQRLAAAAALVQTYSDQDWGAAGWTVTTARQAISTLQRLAILENQGARPGETEAADRELAILFARLNSLVRTGAKDDLLASTEANRAAAEIARQLRGLTPSSETEKREQALAAYQGRAKLWRLVRDRLRLIEQGLSPAERARWDRSDRIEELIAGIHDRATRDDRHRDSVYRALIAAGITSISQLAAMDDTALAEVGLKTSSIKAVRAALSRTAVEATLSGRALPDRAAHRQAVLLATAMRTGPTAAQLHYALRTVLPEVLDAKVAAGKLTAEQAHSLLQAADIWPESLLSSTDVAQRVATMAGMPAEMTGLFDRAGTADGLSRAERDTLIAYAAGALRHTQPGTDGGLAAQLTALAVLHNHVAARDRTRAGAGNTSSDTPGRGDNTPSTPQPATVNTPAAVTRNRRLRRAGVAAAASALLGAVGGFGGGFAALGWGAVPAVLVGAAVAAVITGAAGWIWGMPRARGPPFLAPLVITSWALIAAVTMSGGGPAVAALTVAGAVLGASAVRARLERNAHRGSRGRRGLRTVGRIVATLALGGVLFASSSWLPSGMADPAQQAGQTPSVSVTAVERPATQAGLAASTISAAPDAGRQRPAEVPILRGDTFDELARALGVSSDELAAANPGLKNRNLIIAGETLRVPASWDGTWRLDRTLWDTARRFGVPGGWPTLVAWNPEQLAGRDATKLPSGLRITVVNPSPPETQKPPAPVTPKQAPPKEAPPKAAPPAHAQANQGIAWGNVLLDVLKVIVGGNLAVRGLDRLGKRLDRARDRRVADRAWVALERIAAGLGSDPGRAALDDLVAAERAARELLASPDATPDAVAAAQQAREAAHQAVAELVGDALVDAVRLGVSDRRLARALRRPVEVAALLAGPTRDALGAPTGARPRRRGAEAAAVERAWEKVVARRDAVRQADQRLEALVVSGVRWVLSPRGDNAVLPHDALDRVAGVLGLPRELVESIAIGPTSVDDAPASVWTKPILRIRRFEAFEGRLDSLRRALDDELRKRGFAVAAVGEATDVWRARLELHRAASPGSTSAAGGGPGVSGGAGGSGAADLAGRAPLPAPGVFARRAITKVAGWLRWLRANRPRGPPELELRWRGEIRRLRQQVDQHRPQWGAATKAERGELAANEAARAAVVQQAGGMVGLLRNGIPPGADLVALGESNRRATTASTHDTDARLAFIEAIRPAVRHAASQGLPLRRIVSVTELDWETVSEITREAWPDPGQRAAWVDPVRELWIGFWGWRHPAQETLTLPNGERVSTQELVTRIKRIDGAAGDQLVLLVDGKVAGLIGTERMAVYDLSDGHFHHIGYDDPRITSIEGFLTRLRKAGHQGVITFHPIPQRGIGLTTAGGALYYLVTNVVTMGLLFNRPMLQMWGKFPDVRLLDAVRKLPPELRGRAVLGVVGARMDMPGALGYLRLMAILNPDLAHLVGETTIAKEAVTDLLGDQAIRTINPEWSGLVGKLVTATEMLGLAYQHGELTDERLAVLPDELITLITGQEPVDPEKLGTGLVEAMVTSVKPIADILGDIRHPHAANELRAAAKRIDQGLLPVYNPNLRELLQASADIGYLVVLHNDFGLARLAGNGRFVDTTPDERFGAPLLALLAQYPKAKIVLAHLGVGKFTTLNVEHLELIDQVLSDRRFDHISFDISWNEVTRHLLADKAITDKFIELVRKHPHRFIFGSDAVKPESNAQYFRQHHDLDPIWKRIRDEVGQDAYDNIRWRTLETRLLEAQQDVQQWVYNEMRFPLSRRQWRQVLAHVMPHRRDVLDNWLAEQDEAGREPADHGQGPNYTTLLRNADGTMSRREMNWRENVQLRSLLRWHNVVTPAVVAGARPLRVLLNSIRAEFADRWQDNRQRKQARRMAERSVLDQARDTEGLDLRDPDGHAYTVEALIAAYHTGKALNPDGTDQATAPDQARHVLRLTQESELRRIADQAERDKTRKRLTRSTVVSAAVMIGIVGFLGWQWAPLIAVFFPTINYVAFAARGGLNVHRTLYTHQMRVLVESILERGQFDLHTIRRLAKTMRKYAVFDRATPEQIAQLDQAINKILIIAHTLENLPLQPGQTAGSRHDTALQLFSMFLDEAGNALGAQAQSFHGLNAHGGLLGRLVNTALAMTLVTNLVGHVLGAVTGVGDYDIVQNGFFAAADLLFLVPAGVSAVTGLAGWDAAAHPLLRRLNHWGLRVITVANGLLTYQLGWLHPSPLVFSAAGLTLASGYLAWLSVIAELRAGRLAPRRGATANGVLNASLLSFGVITLLPQHWIPLAISVGAAAVTMWGATQLDNLFVNRWLARRGFPLPSRLPTTAEVAVTLAPRRAELVERIERLRQRLDQTSRLRWDATQTAAGNTLISELNKAHAALMMLDLASPRAAAEVTEQAEHIDSLRGRLDALLASAPSHGPPSTATPETSRPARIWQAVKQLFDQHKGPGATGLGGHGGTLVVGGGDRAREVMDDQAPWLYRAAEPFDPALVPYLARGPPGVQIKVVPAHLRPEGAEGVVAFGWRSPTLAPRGVVLVFADTLSEINAHVAVGRLDPDWWPAALEHERRFHLTRDEHTGPRHDHDATRLVTPLLDARELATADELGDFATRFRARTGRNRGPPPTFPRTAGEEWRHQGWDALQIYTWMRERREQATLAAAETGDPAALRALAEASREMAVSARQAAELEQRRLDELRFDQSDPLQAPILDEIARFADMLRWVGLPIGAWTQEELRELLLWLWNNTYRVDPRTFYEPVDQAWFRGAEWRVGQAPDQDADVPTMRVTEKIGSSVYKITSALRRAGISLPLADRIRLAKQLVIWHELTHAYELAFFSATGHELDELALTTGLSQQLDSDYERALEIESERLAEGVAMMIATYYLPTLVPGQAGREEMLRELLVEELTRDQPDDYGRPHTPGAVYEIFAAAANVELRQQAQRNPGDRDDESTGDNSPGRDGHPGGGAALDGAFQGDEEPRLTARLRAALQLNVARQVRPDRLPATPRGPPVPEDVSVYTVPSDWLRTQRLGRVADLLAAYTLVPEKGRPAIFFTEEMFDRLDEAGMLAEVLRIEIEDRVSATPARGEQAHRRRVAAVMNLVRAHERTREARRLVDSGALVQRGDATLRLYQELQQLNRSVPPPLANRIFDALAAHGWPPRIDLIAGPISLNALLLGPPRQPADGRSSRGPPPVAPQLTSPDAVIFLPHRQSFLFRAPAPARPIALESP